ncbi:MAG: DUF1295 domain-containing protein [Sphingomonadaceae bacterium]|nr:DUF1295 domain-containing protein [Sphingomonadaceae bacterium]
MSVPILLLVIAIALSLLMAAAWTIARRPGFSGWTDVIWTFAVGFVGAGAALAPITGPPQARQWLVATLILFWALRLGVHIMLRTIGHGDDPRYAALRDQWGTRFDANLFGFLQIQAAAGLLLAICVLVAAHNPAPAFAWSDYAGVAVLLVAVLGEGVADAQLQAFRNDPRNKGRVCDAGLWRLSRHPNYFFEWLGWLAYAVIAIGPAGAFAWGWLALSGPAFIYWLLVHVSGIPPLEEHMARSRGAAFDDYRRRVRAFWPVPRGR